MTHHMTSATLRISSKARTVKGQYRVPEEALLSLSTSHVRSSLQQCGFQQYLQHNIYDLQLNHPPAFSFNIQIKFRQSGMSLERALAANLVRDQLISLTSLASLLFEA